MKNFMLRVAPVSAAIAGYGVSAFAADTDLLIPAIDFTTLTANASSVFTQAIPVGLLVAGVAIGLGAIVWVVGLLKTTFRRRSA